MILLSIHCIEGFIQLFWVLSERNTHKVLLRIYEKCYGSENMRTNSPLIFEIGAKSVKASVELK